MNDGPVDYVFVKGGTWMREATATAGGSVPNDAFRQLGDLGTDNVFIHDPAVYLLPAAPVAFGASGGSGQRGKSWQARRIRWYARSAAVVNDAYLSNLQSSCHVDASCDYGIGTHSYTYDSSLTFPSSPWRSLPQLPQHDPDQLTTLP